MKPAAKFILAMSIICAGQASPALAQKGKVNLENLAYGGWKNNVCLKNGVVEVIATLDVGPRIICYRFKDGKNVFKEYADQMGKSGEKEWMIRGGHRLWANPENPKTTYALDNSPVKFRGPVPAADGASVILTPPAEKESGLQKEIELKLADKGTRVTVIHRIKNTGDKETELACWALTVMAPGGVEIIPLPPKKLHPGAAKNAKSPADFAPNQNLALWPFFDFKDPRWAFGSKYITLTQDAKRGATKLGLAQRNGWAGYLNNHTLFVKRFPFQEGKPYPDTGVNFETFTNEDMLEVETLSPLIKLAPGATAEHVETWELFADVKDAKDEAAIDKHILPLLTGK